LTDIEYFYSTHSAYAYIGSRLLIDIANRHQCEIIHRPIDLNPVVEAASGEPFGYRTQKHRDYFFDREIERWAEYRGSPLINHRPTWHDEPLALPNGFVIAAIDQGHDVNQLAHEILKAHWLEDANHADPDILVKIAKSLNFDPAPLLEAALSKKVQAIHEANTKEAIKRSVFGSPTYFIDGDMFYGQDHLELVERALQQPFASSSSKTQPE